MYVDFLSYEEYFLGFGAFFAVGGGMCCLLVESSATLRVVTT
jgi:hypothetical protein